MGKPTDEEVMELATNLGPVGPNTLAILRQNFGQGEQDLLVWRTIGIDRWNHTLAQFPTLQAISVDGSPDADLEIGFLVGEESGSTTYTYGGSSDPQTRVEEFLGFLFAGRYGLYLMINRYADPWD
jgi:hypothetical protein